MIHKYLVIVTGTEGYKFVKEIHPFAVATDILFTENHRALAVRIPGGEMLDPVLLVEIDDHDVDPAQLETKFNTFALTRLIIGYRKLDGTGTR